MERQPNAITSRGYQEMFEKKKLAKRRAEEEKEARKRKRIEAKGKKDKLVPVMTTVKRKLFRKTGTDSYSSSCHKIITSESGVRCDDCNNAFHEKCIPKYHKEHTPVSEDGDEFLCHKCYKVKPSESRTSNEKQEEEESDDNDDDDIDELFGLTHKHK
jgi:hypothetical protein